MELALLLSVQVTHKAVTAQRSGWLGTQHYSQWDGPDAMLLSQTSTGASGWIRSLPNDPRAPTSVFLSKAQLLAKWQACYFLKSQMALSPCV